MPHFLLWYLLITAIGFLTFPLAFRLLPALPERGYAFSRALGLLLWGFIFWLSVSFGLARNDLNGLFATLLVLAAFSLWWGRGEYAALREWFKSQRGYILGVEILFLLAFAGLAFVRSHAPEAIGTEKPMELAFINAVLRSETFPPQDPWLSGYAISYYYFGYVLTGMMAKTTATLGGVAFNLMISLVFGLSAAGAYGLLYNLLKTAGKPRPALFSFFGPLFLLIVSNLEGFLEVLRQRGIGWNGDSGPFWEWLNMKDLSSAPSQPYGWEPERFWWWWRAARVLHDYDLQGRFGEIIDEFPFFSYLLADLHPHVLAMPFGLLAIGLALNLYLGGWKGEIDLRLTKIPFAPQGFVILAVTLGGLAFLNTWDLPVYLALAGAALVFWQVREYGWGWTRLEHLVVSGLLLALASVLLYFPFYASFSSQAGGILPNIIFPTRGAYLWIMFGALFVPIFIFLAHLRGRLASDLRLGFGLAGGFTLLLWLVSLLMGLLAANTDAGQSLIASQGMQDIWEIFGAATARRLAFAGGLLTLVALLGWTAAYLTATQAKAESAPAESHSGRSRFHAESAPAGDQPLPFLLAMILIGGLLALGPEFVYLRDGFGNRMNTVFKFYYQAWTLWSLASAYALAVIFSQSRGWTTWAARIVLLAVLVMGLAYPWFGLPSRVNRFQSEQPTLDAAAYLARYSPEDAAVIAFLDGQPNGVIAEAVGGSYSEYARIATHSGLQNVIGWGWHQWQWRGGNEETAGREDAIRVLYETPSWNQASEILARYNVRYVVVGGLERRTYRVNEAKFANLPEIFRAGDTVVYFVPERP
jgi:YYY domain-containing protein